VRALYLWAGTSPGPVRLANRQARHLLPVQGEQQFTELVNGSTGWNVNAHGQPTRIAATDAGVRQLRPWTSPAGFIQAGLAAPNAAATDRYFGRENRTVKVVAFTTKVCDGPQPQCTRRLTGEFNNDNMLERVITWVPDPVTGDKMIEFRWSDYRDCQTTRFCVGTGASRTASGIACAASATFTLASDIRRSSQLWPPGIKG
jgi:hypothetical protein